MTNVLGLQFLPRIGDYDKAYRYTVETLKPKLVVVLDNLGFARKFRQNIPGTYQVPYVVHRTYNPNDAYWHRINGYKASDWVAAHSGQQEYGVIVQCMNEPSGYEEVRRLSDFVAECMHHAHNAGMRLAVPNFAMGHPSEQAILSGQLDSMIFAFRQYPEHFLAVHEYANSSPKNEPYHIRRYRNLWHRFNLLNVKLPTTLITETGRDKGGGHGDGWFAAFNGNEDRYIEFLKELGECYNADGVFSAIYGYGPGWGWENFNIENAPKILAALPVIGKLKEIPPMATVPAPVTGGVVGELSKLPGAYINVRVQPNTSANVTGNIRLNEKLTYFPAAQHNGWIYVIKGTVQGWVSLQGGAVVFKVYNPDIPAFKLIAPVAFRWRYSDLFGAPRNYAQFPTHLQKHEGVDIVPQAGQTGPFWVVAAADGVVETVGNDPDGYGIFVRVKHEHHGETYKTWYAHLRSNSVPVKAGDVVKGGTVLGEMGSTGYSTGPHLHFTVQHIGKGLQGYVVADVIDPKPLLPDPSIATPEPEPEPEPTPPLVGIGMTADELRQLIDGYHAMFGKLNDAIDILDEVAAKVDEIANIHLVVLERMEGR